MLTQNVSMTFIEMISVSERGIDAHTRNWILELHPERSNGASRHDGNC